jgi:hypothetical protein
MPTMPYKSSLQVANVNQLNPPALQHVNAKPTIPSVALWGSSIYGHAPVQAHMWGVHIISADIFFPLIRIINLI